MNNNQVFETYLFISRNKFIISVITSSNKEIYKDEFFLEENLDYLISDKLNFFLNKNIFNIEKILNNFVEKIFVILEFDGFFSIKVSIKENNYENTINVKNLNHLLYEAKDCCNKTIENRKIIHMVIENYQIDKKNYSSLPRDINGNAFSIDINIICISDKMIKDLEIMLSKYQISLTQVVSAQYVNKYVLNEKNIVFAAKKIISGHNSNEVRLIKKTDKNEGFFEKFFNFFN